MTEPPSVRLANTAPAIMPKEGEYYRLDFPGRTAGLRMSISAWRTPEAIDAGDPLHASPYLET